MFKYISDFDHHSQLVKYLNLFLIVAITILIYVIVTYCFVQCYCQDISLHSINHIVIVAYIKESSGETYELVSEPAHNLLYSYSDLSYHFPKMESEGFRKVGQFLQIITTSKFPKTQVVWTMVGAAMQCVHQWVHIRESLYMSLHSKIGSRKVKTCWFGSA
jgi:hypothetical protein